MLGLSEETYIEAAKDLCTGRHGLFAAHIGEAYLAADSGNKNKLLETFWDVFRRGIQIGE